MTENRDDPTKSKDPSGWNDPGRWNRGVMGGKSPLQVQLEKELEEKRKQHALQNPTQPRKPLKWYWWAAILGVIVLWTTLSFLTYDWAA